jgi:hypothetical protein
MIIAMGNTKELANCQFLQVSNYIMYNNAFGVLTKKYMERSWENMYNEVIIFKLWYTLLGTFTIGHKLEKDQNHVPWSFPFNNPKNHKTNINSKKNNISCFIHLESHPNIK